MRDDVDEQGSAQGQGKSLMERPGEEFLPGMEALGDVQVLKDEDLRRLPVHTAEQVFKKNRERYVLAARLFFEIGVSQAWICSVLKMSPHTLQAILVNEAASDSAHKWRARSIADMRVAQAMAAKTVIQMLGDSVHVKKAGLLGVANVLKILSGAIDNAEAFTREHSPVINGEKVIECAGKSNAYLEMLGTNGLGEEKKEAVESGEAGGQNGLGEGAGEGGDAGKCGNGFEG